MPGVLKHLSPPEPTDSGFINDFLTSELIPTTIDLQAESNRLAREIDASIAATLAEYEELSIHSEGGISRPTSSAIDSLLTENLKIQRILAAAAASNAPNAQSVSTPVSAEGLFFALCRLKADPLHDPLQARTLLNLFENVLEPSAPHHAHLMGEIYWDGWYRPHDLATASKWYAHAYKNGSKRSALRLIACHAFGIGTERNLALAETMRSNLEIAPFHSSQVRRLDQILNASRQTPPLYTSLPARGQVPFAQVKPVYPFQLRRANIEGRAVVSFQVDAAGFTRNLEVKFFTHLEFAQAAVEAVTFWRVASRVSPDTGLSEPIRVPIIFNITDE